MPFTDAVSSVSGRNSRASNVSGMTGTSHTIRSGPPPTSKSNDMLSNAGVLSMLKTSTDTGDIGSLSFNQTRLPTMPRPAHQRRGHVQRPSVSEGSHHYPASTASRHHYAPSQTSRISDSASLVRRGSLTSMQSMPPSLPPVSIGRGQLQMPPPALDRARDSRSYSMTSAPLPGQLPRHQSATSLRSAGHETRHGTRMHPGQTLALPENRPPYVYPTRLKRPGYRSPSPALSELSGQSMPLGPSQPDKRPQVPMHRPQPQSYNSDYGPGYLQEPHPRHVHGRPPPRAMNSSPVMVYEQHAQFAYHPSAMRSAPALAMQPRPPMPYPGQYPPQHQGLPQHRGPPRTQPGAPHYGPPRAGYGPFSHALHPGYPNYPGYHHTMYRGPPPQASTAPMAHSMFHNAARMARQLPQRTDTPMTDVGPPSSDPPSSGTAPSSSSPVTPKDQSTLQVAVDPIFIDPAFTDLPDSSSDPVLPARYFEYAEGLDKQLDEPEMEVPHPSVPPTGFVQRVRAMLESKAALEAAAVREAERERTIAQSPDHLADGQAEQEDACELHEMAANETPRFTIIEEFDAPVELPASPVKLPELADSPVVQSQQHRLTREVIKAHLGPTDSIDDSGMQTSTSEIHGIDVEVQIKQQPSNGSTNTPKMTTQKNAQPAGSLLATPGNIQRQASTTESASTASPGTTGISGIDYALRFSVPVDTTIASEETQSKDPFILDADTITLQHQRSKEKVCPAQPRPSMQSQRSANPAGHLEEPVSPLQPGEDVTRSSAVSPLQTQTLGIDETLHLVADARADDTSSMSQSTAGDATATEGTLPPPTPRTPRTYSKSVQLPHNSMTATETPSSNRFSLPPDLSTMAESTNTHSDMITDVAVRFSLPNTTITIGKPQIITIPPSSSPEKPDTPQKSEARRLEPKSARRNSVTFADQVAPLNIKKSNIRHDTQSQHDIAANKVKSIIRRPSPIEDASISTRSSRDTTTDLRFPTGNGLNGRFGSTHLPGLKEESIEDMSINEQHRRSNSHGNSQQLQLPARIAAVKAMQERRLQETAEKAKARRAARHNNRPLAEIRDLPSLNFSRMDLIEKLNQALDVRTSKSMEMVRRRDFSGIYCPSPQRPQSTEPLRERYVSFFSKPEDFSFFEEEGDQGVEPEEDLRTDECVPIVEVQESTKLEDNEGDGSRPLSPEDFLNVATQVNRLSIPSVTGLSERLSNLLPSLRNLHLDSVLASDEEVAHIIDDIHQLGHAGRPDTVLSNRTSAGFRTLAERADEIVQNGTHDSIVPTSRLLLTNKELPPLPESASADKVSAVNSTDGKQSYLSGSVSAPSDLGKEPALPQSVLVRQKSPTSEEEVRSLLPPEMNPITRSKRSLVISSASRPWNQDENYPWAGTNVPVDLSIPTEAHTRGSLTGDLKRRSKSLDFNSSGEQTDTTKGIDIGSITTDMDCSASINTEQATGVKSHHLRHKSKRSIIGSISRKIGLTGHNHVDDCLRSVPSPALRSEDSQPHKPGDRYPSTGLTPPVNLHPQLDEIRSFFSDNSSEEQRHASSSFPKRLTRFKGKGKAVRLDATRGVTSMDENTAYDAGSMNAQRDGALSVAHTYDGIGMGKAEFRIKRFGEKLRHLFAKGGELIRSMSHRSKLQQKEGVRDDWLSDSLYSGV